VDPQNKHTIVDHIVISSEKKSIDQVKKLRKQKNTLAKEKVKGMFEKKYTSDNS